MLIAIPDVLDAAGVARLRGVIDAGGWADGNATSGPQSALAKRNEQLPEDDAAARAGGGQAFGMHVDNAIRLRRGSDFRIRSDLSATLFLTDPDSYDGGELVIEDQFGEQRVKLPAGHMVLYPASSLHRVEPVTRGTRVASFFWIQSMVRDDAARRILFELDQSVQAIAADKGQGDATVIRLTGVYHNLLRRWADA
jgi:PKHD-type hydroxylase